MRARSFVAVLVVLVALGGAAIASADSPTSGTTFGAPAGTSYSPLVPVSAFARPASWFDASRLHVSTSVTVGTGWGGRTDALQVTSLSYQLATPLAVRFSVGNSFGTGSVSGGKGMFLEGFAVSYRPHPSFQVTVDYRDIRSPLQYSHPSGFGILGR